MVTIHLHNHRESLNKEIIKIHTKYPLPNLLSSSTDNLPRILIPIFRVVVTLFIASLSSFMSIFSINVSVTASTKLIFVVIYFHDNFCVYVCVSYLRIINPYFFLLKRCVTYAVLYLWFCFCLVFICVLLFHFYFLCFM